MYLPQGNFMVMVQLGSSGKEVRRTTYSVVRSRGLVVRGITLLGSQQQLSSPLGSRLWPFCPGISQSENSIQGLSMPSHFNLKKIGAFILDIHRLQQ